MFMFLPLLDPGPVLLYSEHQIIETIRDRDMEDRDLFGYSYDRYGDLMRVVLLVCIKKRAVSDERSGTAVAAISVVEE